MPSTNGILSNAKIFSCDLMEMKFSFNSFRIIATSLSSLILLFGCVVEKPLDSKHFVFHFTQTWQSLDQEVSAGIPGK